VHFFSDKDSILVARMLSPVCFLSDFRSIYI
jgi:hypothetical protein